MTCDVISTGSIGNAVLLNGKYLFDCGVPYKKLGPHVKRLSAVFLTHIHGDHFKIETIRRLHQKRPSLLFVCGRNLLVPLCTRCGVDPGNVVLVTPGETAELHFGAESVLISAFDLIHNVENIGFAVEVQGGTDPGRALYATDTQYIPISAPGYDLYMVESNYTPEELQQRRERKLQDGKFSYEDTVAASHMSSDTVRNWLCLNASQHSEVVFLHQHVKKEASHDPV